MCRHVADGDIRSDCSEQDPYYKALEAADAAWREKKIDVSEMEQLLESLLANQLYTVVEAAKQATVQDFIRRSTAGMLVEPPRIEPAESAES